MPEQVKLANLLQFFMEKHGWTATPIGRPLATKHGRWLKMTKSDHVVKVDCGEPGSNIVWIGHERMRIDGLGFDYRPGLTLSKTDPNLLETIEKFLARSSAQNARLSWN